VGTAQYIYRGLLNLGAAAESIARSFPRAPYKTNPTSLFAFHSLSPPLLFPSIMDAIKSILSPLGVGTGAIQDTLVTTYSCICSGIFLYVSLETRGHWRNNGNRSSSFNVGLEWFRRL
jgi:hypothetical protein